MISRLRRSSRPLGWLAGETALFVLALVFPRFPWSPAPRGRKAVCSARSPIAQRALSIIPSLSADDAERDDRPRHGSSMSDRAPATDYAEIRSSIPPNHKHNEIEWASEPPGDPNVHSSCGTKNLDGDGVPSRQMRASAKARGQPQGFPVR